MALAVWQRTIVDDTGAVQSGASVRVELEGGGLASLFSDRAGTMGISNPFLSDSNGFAQFFVDGGAYKITVTKGSFSQELRYAAVATGKEYDVDVLARLDQANLLLGSQTIQASDSTTLTGYVTCQPTDFGVGKPRFAITKLASATNWEIGIFDGVDNSGVLKISADLIEVLDVLRVNGANIELSNGGSRILSGSGDPEGSVTAVVGSLYLRTDGGTDTTLYVKESGSGNTGWAAK